VVLLSIFKQYDIRGVYPKEINEKIFYKLAKACSKYFEGKTALIGCDGRLSSLNLKNSVIQALLDDGIEVYDVGLVSTSTFNFLISLKKFDFGIQITASHNPKDYNGMKIYDNNGNSIGLGFGLEKIKEIFENEKFNRNKIGGKLVNGDFLKKLHIDFLIKKAVKSDVKFALDFSNGVGSIVLKEVLNNNYNFISINEKIDGNFPSHSPEPSEESLSELRNIVKIKNLDFGACFDGDADRIVFVDDEGNVIRGDQILYLFSYHLNAKKIVCEVSFPPKFSKFLKSLGKEIYETKVGRTFIINKMREVDADVGGEISSHFYFKETNFMEDAFYSLLILISILEKEKKKLSEVLKDYTLGKFINYKIEVDEDKKYTIIEKLKDNFRKDYEVLEIDGIKVIISDEDWFLIRASNTEPVIRIYIESLEEKKIEEYRKIIDNYIKSFASNLK